VILVDTSVWVHHLRKGDDHLAELLHAGEVASHPFVIGELACGGIRNREVFLALLSALPVLAKAEDAEVLDFIDHHRLMGRGLGLIDVHLLASCMLAGAGLWTRDRRLAQAAARLGCADGSRAT
jgi:hypothetical protein